MSLVLSLITFSIGTLPHLSPKLTKALYTIELVTVILFTLEYLLRIIVSDRKMSFIFSFYGMIDLLTILPFYISMGVDLRSVRIFRLFRLFRIFKVIRYTSTIDRFRNAFISIKNELMIFFISSGFLLYLAGVGIYYFENPAQPERSRPLLIK